MLSKILIWYLIASSSLYFCVGRGTSMDKTFADGQILVLREVVAYSPQAGDIVTFPMDKIGKVIKRVVAVGGDLVEVRDHQLYINNQATGYEGYLETCAPIVLAGDCFYAVGDSYWSIDCRFFGPISAAIVEDVYVRKLPIILPPRDEGH